MTILLQLTLIKLKGSNLKEKRDMKVDGGLVGTTKGSPGSWKEGRGWWVCVTKMQISHTHIWSCQIVNTSVNVEARLRI